MCWLFAITQSAADDPQPTVSATWEFDFDLFHLLLELEGLQAVDIEPGLVLQEHWNDIFVFPSRSVMVLTGNIEPVCSWSSFHTFLSQGGVILVASSEASMVYGFFRIDYGPAISNHRRNTWQGYTDCLQVRDIDSSAAMMQNVSTIVTNRSGWIAHLGRSPSLQWSVLANLPQNLRPSSNAGQPVAAVATDRHGASGRLIVMADDSPLSNGMLWHGDNLTLLTNIVHELTRDGRNTFMFLHNGVPAQSRVTELLSHEPALRSADLSDVASEAPDRIPPVRLAELPADILLQIGNKVSGSIEDSDVLNEVLVHRPRHLIHRHYHRSILLAVSAAAVAIFLVCSCRNIHRRLPWLRQREPPETQGTPVSMQEAEYNHAIQALSRDVCRHLTGGQEPSEWQLQLQPSGSTWLTVSARSPSPQATADAIAEILLWSTDRTDRWLSRTEFERLGQTICQLKQLATDSESTDFDIARTQEGGRK